MDVSGASEYEPNDASRQPAGALPGYDVGMRRWARERATTDIAILIALMLTLTFGYIAIDSILGAIDPERLGRDFGRGVLPFSPTGTGTNASAVAANASAIVGLAIGSVVLVSAVIVSGLLFRRDWAREAGLVIYGLLGLMAIGASLGGLFADPPARSAWLGILTGVADLAIAGLLLAPATATHFRHKAQVRAAAEP